MCFNSGCASPADDSKAKELTGHLWYFRSIIDVKRMIFKGFNTWFFINFNEQDWGQF